MNASALMRELRGRASFAEPCQCPCCRAERGGKGGEPIELYVLCESCGIAVETLDGRTCGICGVEAPDRVPDNFYLGSS